MLLVDAETGEVVRDLTPGRWDSPTFSVGGGGGYAFSPDGRELCVVSNHDPDQARSTNSDLWLVSIEPAVDRRSTSPQTNRGWDGDPVYSPDGRFIAFRSQATPGTSPISSGSASMTDEPEDVRYLTDASNFDNWINDLQWSQDGDALYFTGDLEGRERRSSGSVWPTKTPQQIVADGAIVGWDLAVGDAVDLHTVAGGGTVRGLFDFRRRAASRVRLTSLQRRAGRTRSTSGRPR